MQVPESKASRGLFIFLSIGAAGILAVIGLFAAKGYADIFSSYKLLFLAASLIAIAGIILIGMKVDWGNQLSQKAFIILIIILTLAPRLFWILSVRTAPFSDFLHMQNYGAAVSRGEFTNYVDFYSLSPFKFGFGFVMGGIYWLFGPDPLVAGIFNVFLSVFQVWLVYLITREIRPDAARAAALFYALWPAQIMYCTLVAAENTFLVFFLAAIYVFIRYAKYHTGDKKGYALLVLTGGLMALAQAMRPTGMILIPVIAIFVLFYVSYHKQRLRNLLKQVLCILIAAVSYYAVLKLISVPIKDLSGIDLTRSGSGYYLMVGTNYEANGMFNWKDFYFMRDHNFDFDVVHSEATRLAIQRIEEDPVRFLKLVVKKINFQWGKENYGYYWSTISADSGNAVENTIKLHPRVFYAGSQLYYLIILLLGIIGCYWAYKNKNYYPVILYLILGGLFLAYFFLEVQSRYHITAVPLLIIPAALGALEIKSMHFRVK